MSGKELIYQAIQPFYENDGRLSSDIVDDEGNEIEIADAVSDILTKWGIDHKMSSHYFDGGPGYGARLYSVAWFDATEGQVQLTTFLTEWY